MKVTNTDNQELRVKNKVENFFTKAMVNRKKKGFCITKDVMAVLLDKWSLFVIYNLGYYKVLRFNELKTNIRGISSRMLSVTLKKLESNGVVERKVFAEVPPRVEYTLTDFGLELVEKTVDLNDWFLNKFLKEGQEFGVGTKKTPTSGGNKALT